MGKEADVLVVGGGAREDAIAWKLRQSPDVGKLFIAPGNAGTERWGINIPIGATDISNLVTFASDNKIGLTIVGPDDPLALGIVDEFEKNKLRAFGPKKEAAKLEWSKADAVKFMQKYGIPHPESRIFSNSQQALDYIEEVNYPVVIKADGLALGKGVIIPKTRDEAWQAVREMIDEGKFGDAGRTVVVQEKLIGREMSFFVISDGDNIIPLISSQDYKRIGEGDKGPNTGGMGSFAPSEMSQQLFTDIYREIAVPTIRGARDEGRPFKGVLYLGLMIVRGKPIVIEYNARFGDPETQVLLSNLETDLFQIASASIDGGLNFGHVNFKKSSSVCVVLAAKGYPESPQKGEKIEGLKKDYGDEVIIFQAGTKREGEDVVTNGGRVLSIVGSGDSVWGAKKAAYSAIGREGVYFEGMQYRRDIARDI